MLGLNKASVVYFNQRLGTANPIASRNSHFQHFLCKKAKKCKQGKNLMQHLAKQQVFKVCTNTLDDYINIKNSYLSLKKRKAVFWGIKPLNSILVQT